MRPACLYHYATTIGVRLRAEDGKLRYSAPAGVMTPELQKALVAFKPALLAVLAGRPQAEPEPGLCVDRPDPERRRAALVALVERPDAEAIEERRAIQAEAEAPGLATPKSGAWR